MILPTKHLSANRALLQVGAKLICLLDEPKTVSRLWEELRQTGDGMLEKAHLTYDWFILALDLLYIMNVVKFEHPFVRRVRQ